MKELGRKVNGLRTMEDFGQFCLDVEMACAIGEIDGWQKNKLLYRAERQMIKLGLMEIWRAN